MSLAEDIASSNQFIQAELKKKLVAVGDRFQADPLTIIAPMRHQVDDIVREAVEEIDPRRQNLLVILETDGGQIEVVERMANLFRYYYSHGEVSFLIPNFAMSAGTVLAMSGDNIFMDYYSILGPIDPQVQMQNQYDRWVPALGYLEKYAEFIKRGAKGKLTDVEIAFFVNKFDPAELHQFEQARDLSIELLKRWLVNYKFKNWNRTQTRGLPVSLKDKETRADQIAKKLNNVKIWKSHGRGLSKDVLERELNLLIDDYAADPERARCVRAYYRLLKDYMMRVNQGIVVQTVKAYTGFGGGSHE